MPEEITKNDRVTTSTQLAMLTWWRYLRSDFPFGDYIIRKTETLLLLPLAIILSPVSVMLLRSGLHIWPIFTERLGHQCLESDCAIRWSRTQRKTRRIMLVSRRRHLANQSFFDHLPRGTSHHEGWLVHALAVSLTYFNHYRKARSFCRVPTAWQTHRSVICSTQPTFKMKEADRTEALQLLEHLVQTCKLSKDIRTSKTYCVFNFRHPYPEVAGDRLQAQRYSSAAHLESALRYLRDAGILPILTGAPPRQETDQLPSDLYINYATSEWKSDRNDVLLCGNATLCLGSTSGLTLLSSVFGVPCVIHNQVPYKEFWYCDFDLVVPKLMRDKKTGRLAPYCQQIIESTLNKHYIVDSPDVQFIYEECAEDDILDATIEMCKRLNLVPGNPTKPILNSCGSVSPAFKRKYVRYLPAST